jgi:hypothetical protein
VTCRRFYLEDLFPALQHEDIVAAVVGSAIADLYRSSLLHPLLPRLQADQTSETSDIGTGKQI